MPIEEQKQPFLLPINRSAVQNPYNTVRLSNPVPIPNSSIRGVPYKCERREKWVNDQGPGYVEIMEIFRKPGCYICVQPEVYYEINSEGKLIVTIVEKSSKLARCFWV